MSYCVLDASEVRRLEDDGVSPCCAHHIHISNTLAERGIADQAYRTVGEHGRRVMATPNYVWAGRMSAGFQVLQMVAVLGRRPQVSQADV